MNETAEQHETQSAPPPPATKRDYFAEFKALPIAEKLIAAGALGLLLAFGIGGRWSNFFDRWFDGLGVLGALGVLLLTATNLRGGVAIGTNVRSYGLVIFAAAPAVGFVIDELGDFWRFAMLAGGVAMGLAAYRINARDDLL